MLNKLDAALQRDDGKAETGGDEPDDSAADFIAELRVVIQKLAKALQDQEQVSGQADTLLTETTRRRESHLSASTADSVDNRGLSRDTSVRSSNTSHSGYGDVRLSPDPLKLPAIAEQKVLGGSFAPPWPSPPPSQQLPAVIRHPADAWPSPAAVASQQRPDVGRHPVDASTFTQRSSSVTSHGVGDPTLAEPSPDFNSASNSPAPTLTPDLRSRDSGYGLAARSSSNHLYRAYTDPSQLGQIAVWPPHGMQAGPVHPGQVAIPAYHSSPAYPLPQSLYPAPPPSTALPLRPQYYIANPDQGFAQPVELPGEDSKSVPGGPYRTWQAVPPQYALPHLRSPPQQQHPALRQPYGPYQAYDHGQYRDVSSADQLAGFHKDAGLVPERRPLSRTQSTSSEALPLQTRWEARPDGAVAETARSDPSAESVLGQALIDDTIRQWNGKNWGQAGSCLQECHRRAVGCNNLELARRMGHLLGTVASVQGQWQQALTSFISVLRAAIVDDANLDDGDATAAYWLGDTYCLLNRRAEALTAYLIAEHSSLFRGTALRQRILAEQKACIPLSTSSSSSSSAWNSAWEHQAKQVDRTSSDSILRSQILTRAAEQKLLDRARVRAGADKDAKKQHILDMNHSRVMAFRVLGADAGSYDLDYQLKIGPSAFDTTGPWPLMFDPYFAMANIVRGRLLTDECDLLSLVKFEASLNVPKAGRNKKITFTHQDLQWLIVTIKTCLKAAGMVVSEVANAAECSFVARYQATSSMWEGRSGQERRSGQGIATWNFLTISIFRQSYGRSGYGVDIASEGLYSARILRGDWLYDKGVSTTETERVRSLVLEHLNAEARQDSTVAERLSVEKVGSLPRRKGPFSFASSGSANSRPASLASR